MYKVPEGYLEEDRHTVQNLLERIKRVDGGQEELDAIYTEMMDVIKAGLAEVRMEERRGHRGQPWFTNKIAGQIRPFHKAEADWLKCKDPKVGDRGGKIIAKRGGRMLGKWIELKGLWR